MSDADPQQELEKELSFLGRVVRHDLREPLRAVQGFTRGIADRYSDVIDERGLDRLRRVVDAASRLDAMVLALGAFLEVRCLDPRREPVPGRELVDDALEGLDGEIERSGAHVDVAAELPLLDVDRDWAMRALSHLVENAIVFGEGDAPWISVSGLEDGSGFVVADRGSGFAADPETLFPLFRRGVGRDVPGLGAGLTIAKMVARRHGGDVWVRSSKPSGSEVAISFATDGGDR